MKVCIGFVNTACVGLMITAHLQSTPLLAQRTHDDEAIECAGVDVGSGASTQTGSSYDSGGEVKGQN